MDTAHGTPPASTPTPPSRRSRWEAATRWPLLALSAVFLGTYSLLVLADPASHSAGKRTLVALLVVAWAAFVVDFVVRILLTARHSRLAYVGAHRIDVISVLLPVFKSFRLLRHLRGAPGFRGNGGDAVRSRLLVQAAAYAIMFLYVISLSVLAVERPAPGATITTFGNALWWSCETVSTVGFGDYAPVTPPGRMLAVLLMIGGVAIIGTSSALIVSYLAERIHNPSVGRPLLTAPVTARPADREGEGGSAEAEAEASAEGDAT